MFFSDITNIHNERTNKCEKTKTIKIASPKKKATLNLYDFSALKFEWIYLKEDEVKIMQSDEIPNCSLFDHSLWLQNYITHFTYPKLLENTNISESLKNHNIDELKRHSLFCWLGYVLASQDTASNETYFLTISLFDQFVSKCTQLLSNSDLLIIGTVCLSIASKQKDIFCITMQQLQLVNQQIPESSIIKVIFKVLETLQYQIEYPTFFQSFDYIMRELEYRYYKEYQIIPIEKTKIIYSCAVLLLKFVSQYYDSTLYKFSQIAYVCIHYTLKKMEYLQFKFPQEFYKILQQIQIDHQINNIELTQRYIFRLCQNGMSDKQKEFLPQTHFYY